MSIKQSTLFLSLLIAATALSGCSATLPVQGNFTDTNERFLGSATGKADGNGNLTLTSESGQKCSGAFKYDEGFVSGAGNVTCTDGRTGTFSFTSSGAAGSGFGKLSDGQPFKFRFGYSQRVIVEQN